MMTDIKLAMCAGHGGFKDAVKKIYSTAGKRTPDGVPEWELNNTVIVAFENELKKYEGIEILRTDDRTGKTDVPLSSRTNAANKWGADYYISFHHNAFTGSWNSKATGVETFIYTGSQPKSEALAKALHPVLVEGYGLFDRGIKKGNLHIVRETKMPAILIEGGFMDSTIDIEVLRDKSKLENTGKLLARAFAKFTGLKLKQVDKPVEILTKEEIVKMLNVTGRDEAKQMIKKGVAEGLFTSKHENVDKYTDEELISYSLAYINRKFKKIDK